MCSATGCDTTRAGNLSFLAVCRLSVVFWVSQIAAGWLISEQNGNVGFLLIAALPMQWSWPYYCCLRAGCPIPRLTLPQRRLRAALSFYSADLASATASILRWPCCRWSWRGLSPCWVGVWQALAVSLFYMMLISGVDLGDNPLPPAGKACQHLGGVAVMGAVFFWPPAPIRSIYRMPAPAAERPAAGGTGRRMEWRPGATLLPTSSLEYALDLLARADLAKRRPHCWSTFLCVPPASPLVQAMGEQL